VGDAWGAGQIAQLPQAMGTVMTIWLDVMKHESRTPPRRKPRSQVTIELHLRLALPTLRLCAGGHLSLREIIEKRSCVTCRRRATGWNLTRPLLPERRPVARGALPYGW
jgi:hypothetical protein